MSREITSQESLATIKAAQQKPFADPRFASLEKSSFTESASATSGLTFYDLEAGAKLIYPVLTPLRNMIPRVSGKGGIQANWRAITAINSSGLRIGVSAANRGGVMAVATQDYSAAYKGRLHAAPHSIIKHHRSLKQKLSLNLNLLLAQLQKVSLQDLQTAKADADAQKDAVASACYTQIITLVTNQQSALKAQQNLPDVHVVTTFQQVRDFALALRQGSPLSTACAPLANEVKMDVLNFVAGVTAGSLSLASFGL